MIRNRHEYIALGALALLLLISAKTYMGAPFYIHKTKTSSVVTPQETPPLYEGDYVVVNLSTLTIELRHGTSTISTLDIISIGKPGSYYETIGGAYENDYKMTNHYSSIGHVYMPWSVHVFGNFFIHGIPYYPDGTKVASTYSGGCIRLSDIDAKRIYDFVQKGTPIIVTEREASDFIPTATSTSLFTSMELTRLMTAVVSLEVLTQDTPLYDPVSKTYTTRRALLPQLLSGNDSLIRTLARSRGNDTFLMYMNEKARSLGLTNTTFSVIDGPASTSAEDLERFNTYIATYKTYLSGFASSTPR